ncbi:MAG: hypothetical protein ACTSRZ_02710 [Promethearchaeota archaeon]
MNKLKKIKKKIDNIILQLKVPDEKYQSVALNALSHLVKKEEFTEKQIKKIIPYLEKIIKDEESLVRNDCIKAICEIGKKKFDLIANIFPLLSKEIESKNRFRIQSIIDMISELRYSNNIDIQNFIKEFLKKTPEWFDKPYLKSIIKDFWNIENKKIIPFIDNYKDEINESIKNYPENFSDIKNLILEKMNEYEINKLNLEKRNKEEILKIKEKIQDKQSLLYQPKITANKESPSEINIIENQLPSKLPEEEFINKSSKPLIENSINESFTTFSKLGLKRKEQNIENNEE